MFDRLFRSGRPALLLGLLCVAGAAGPIQAAVPAPKPRVIIMADMSHDPDEEQQMVHMLM